MEQLTKFYVIEASVFALQMNEQNQAAIIQTISDAVKAQKNRRFKYRIIETY